MSSQEYFSTDESQTLGSQDSFSTESLEYWNESYR